MGWFNREIVNAGLVDKELGKFYLDAFEMRQEGDYDDLVTFELKYIEDKFNVAQEFIKTIKEIINS